MKWVYPYVQEKNRMPIHAISFYNPILKNRRIDFTRKDWFSQFLSIREKIAKNRNNQIDNAVEKMIQQDEGYSIANLTHVYSIITNVCVDFQKFPDCSLQFHERKNDSILEQASPYYNMKCFYLYNLKDIYSVNNPANISSFNNVLLVKLRWEKNIYHTLEGFSSLFYYAMHPEVFPTIKYILIIRHRDYPIVSWTSIFEDLLPSLFDRSIRPVIKLAPLARFCEKAIVLGGSWQPYGYGSFISEPVLADMIRALVYKFINWEYKTPSDNRLSVFFLKRGGKRSISNSDSIYHGLKERYNNSICLQYNRLEDISGREQMILFSKLDILIGPHGAGSTNSIFMLPKSAVIEIFPPHFYYNCYEKLCIGLDIQYEKVIASGNLPNCKNKVCSKQELRDRHFNISIVEIITTLNHTIETVRKEKFLFPN